MGTSDSAVQPVDEGNSESTVRFLIEWVSDGEAAARSYLADHAEPDGASLIATDRSDTSTVTSRSYGSPITPDSGAAEFRWFTRSRWPGCFGGRVATLLMDAAEQLVRDRGIATLGITVGLFDEYGPAQRLYGRRGYIPDGRGACRGQRPLSKGMQVTIDDDLIIWLTKDLVS